MKYVDILMLISNIHNMDTAKEAKAAMNERYLLGGDHMEILQEFFRKKILYVFGQDPKYDYIDWLFESNEYYVLRYNGLVTHRIPTQDVRTIGKIFFGISESDMCMIEYKTGVVALEMCDTISVVKED